MDDFFGHRLLDPSFVDRIGSSASVHLPVVFGGLPTTAIHAAVLSQLSQTGRITHGRRNWKFRLDDFNLYLVKNAYNDETDQAGKNKKIFFSFADICRIGVVTIL